MDRRGQRVLLRVAVGGRAAEVERHCLARLASLVGRRVLGAGYSRPRGTGIEQLGAVRLAAADLDSIVGEHQFVEIDTTRGKPSPCDRIIINVKRHRS